MYESVPKVYHKYIHINMSICFKIPYKRVDFFS